MAKARRRGKRKWGDRLSFGVSLITVAGVAIFIGWLGGQYAIRWITSGPGSVPTATDVRRFQETMDRAPARVPVSRETPAAGGDGSLSGGGAERTGAPTAPSAGAGSSASTGPSSGTPSSSATSDTAPTRSGDAPASVERPLPPVPAAPNAAALAELAPKPPAGGSGSSAAASSSSAATGGASRATPALSSQGATGPEPSSSAPSRSDGATMLHRVQVGAFRQRDGAQRMVDQLTAAGFEAIIVSGDLHRVQVGAFRDEERARSLVAQLQESGFEAIIAR